MRTIQPCPELAANALGQFGCTKTLNGILGYFSLPLCSNSGGAHPRDPLYYLGELRRGVLLSNLYQPFGFGNTLARNRARVLKKREENEKSESESEKENKLQHLSCFNDVPFSSAHLYNRWYMEWVLLSQESLWYKYLNK